mmetsp:Transcript_31240/g.30885  ORF Transcript_31240/g.30885 Transcript_31240/m.30885 type:complete len:106 (+) Transcript_31240:517-834(+)
MKIITTAILLGKHDSFKLFLTMHIFAAAYVVIDSLSDSFFRLMPLALIPWLVNLCYKVRLLRTKNLSFEMFSYVICYYALTVIGIKLSRYDLGQINQFLSSKIWG